MEKAFEGKYRDILIQYLEHQDEEILYTCEKLSREAMEERVSQKKLSIYIARFLNYTEKSCRILSDYHLMYYLK